MKYLQATGRDREREREKKETERLVVFESIFILCMHDTIHTNSHSGVVWFLFSLSILPLSLYLSAVIRLKTYTKHNSNNNQFECERQIETMRLGHPYKFFINNDNDDDEE